MLEYEIWQIIRCHTLQWIHSICEYQLIRTKYRDIARKSFETNENTWIPLKTIVTHLEIVITKRVKIYHKNNEISSLCFRYSNDERNIFCRLIVWRISKFLTKKINSFFTQHLPNSKHHRFNSFAKINCLLENGIKRTLVSWTFRDIVLVMAYNNFIRYEIQRSTELGVDDRNGKRENDSIHRRILLDSQSLFIEWVFLWE